MVYKETRKKFNGIWDILKNKYWYTGYVNPPNMAPMLRFFCGEFFRATDFAL